MSTGDSAVAAAAERLLSDRRAARIKAAETALARGRDALAEAQVARTNASRALVKDGSEQARREALLADDTARACGLRVEALESELTEAKARTTAKERDAAAALVAAQRRWADVPERRRGHMEDLQAAAGELIRVLREGGALYLDALHCSSELQDRHEQLGDQVHGHTFYVPPAEQIAAAAVLDACRSAGFSPADFTQLGVAVRTAAVAASPVFRESQFDDRPARTAEDERVSAEQRKAWTDRLAAQAWENSLANNAEAARDGIVTGRDYGDDRTTLAVDE